MSGAFLSVHGVLFLAYFNNELLVPFITVHVFLFVALIVSLILRMNVRYQILSQRVSALVLLDIVSFNDTECMVLVLLEYLFQVFYDQD